MSALSNATTLLTIGAGMSAALPNSPLDMMPGFGEGFKVGLFAFGAGATFALRIIE